MKLIKLTYILMIAAVITSCKKERDLSYQGPDVVEFSNPVTGVNSKLAGQSIGGISVVGDNASIPVRGDRDSIVINLVAPHRGEPITVNYTITGGTAVQGTDYEIIGTTGSAVIAANSSVAVIRLRLLNASVTPTDIKTLNFRITGTDKSDVGVSENYRTFALSIYPMKAWVNKTVSTTGGVYFSSANGVTYSSAAGNVALADIAVNFSSRVANGVTYPALTSPRLLSGNAQASATRYSARVFIPAATVPEYLLASWATTQLGNISSASVNAIPVTGTAAAAATLESVEIVKDGIYGFVNSNGKKGYIRIKSILAATITFDVMAQP